MQHHHDILDENMIKPKFDYRTDIKFVYPEVMMF